MIRGISKLTQDMFFK